MERIAGHTSETFQEANFSGFAICKIIIQQLNKKRNSPTQKTNNISHTQYPHKNNKSLHF